MWYWSGPQVRPCSKTCLAALLIRSNCAKKLRERVSTKLVVFFQRTENESTGQRNMFCLNHASAFYTSHNIMNQCWWITEIRGTNSNWKLTLPVCVTCFILQWRHNGRNSVSNHQPHDCLLNCSFRRRSKKTSKLRVTGLCEGNSPGTGEFPAQMASNAENVSIWWRHHEKNNNDMYTVRFL